MDAGHAGGDGAEWTAGGGAGFRVPSFELADAASESDDQHAFLLFGQRLSHGGGGEGAEAGDGGAGAGAGPGAKKLATANEVNGAVAGVKE